MKVWAEAVWRQWLGTTDAPDLGADSEYVSRRLFEPPSENYAGVVTPFRTAWVDAKLEEVAKRQGIRPAPFWPERSPYAVCFTHDIDRILSTVHGLRDWRRTRWKGALRIGRDLSSAFLASDRERNPFFNFTKMERMEKDWGVRSASYVLFERRRWAKALLSGEWQHAIGVYHPRQIFPQLRRYEQQGNEVGIHGSFDSWNDSQALCAEVAALRAGGVENITGARNHYLQFDTHATLEAQHRAGIQYDSTMGFNLRNGFRSGTCFPFRWGKYWELPFQLMDSALRFQHRDVEARHAEIEAVQAEVRKHGGVLVLNWHLHVMNPETFPEETALLARVVKRAKEDGAWIALPREVISWWEARVERPSAMRYSE